MLDDESGRLPAKVNAEGFYFDKAPIGSSSNGSVTTAEAAVAFRCLSASVS